MMKPTRERRLLFFRKAHVKTYQRRTTSGQSVTVQEHDDARQAAKPYQPHPRQAQAEEGKAERGGGHEEEKAGKDTTPSLHTDQPSFTPTPPPASEEEAGAWLEAVLQEPDIQQAMKTVSEGTPTDHIYKQADGSYAPERVKLHESIVASMLNPKAVAQADGKPHAVILLGPPGAGKTTTLGPISQELGVEFTHVNADDVKAKLPEYTGVNAGTVHEESSDIAEGQLFPRALQDRHHMVIDITGSNGEKTKQLVGNFHDAGYEVSIMYAHLPYHKAAARVVDRYRRHGRFVPPGYVLHKVDGNPENTYNELKNDPRVAHYRRYNTDVDKDTPAPLQEEGRNPKSPALTTDQFAKGISGTRRSTLSPDGRRANGSTPTGIWQGNPTHPLIRRAHRYHAELTKSLIYLDEDLTSPDLDPSSRGVLRAERLKTLDRLQSLDHAMEKIHGA